MTTFATGNEWFASSMAIAAVLAIACALAMARVAYRQWRAPATERSRPWRVAGLLLMQPLCAALLYFALLPPTTPGEAGVLVVASADAAPSQLTAVAGEAVVALPEAPALIGVERQPDLATALRHRPGTQRVRVIGNGLVARDRDGAKGVTVEFVPNALPRGLVELALPARATAGAVFRVGGRAHALQNGYVDLLDPAGQGIDRAALRADGRFALAGTTRGAGAVSYRLRLSDAHGRPVETVELPLQVEAPPAPRVLVLAGAPGPEVKYLRRWMRDAGMDAHAQLGAGNGLQLGDAPIALNAASLSKFDLVVLDERAWSALGDTQRGALNSAVRDGLGVLLRVTAGLSQDERRRLRAWGFDSDEGRDASPSRLAVAKRSDEAERARIGPGTRDAPRLPDAQLAELPSLTRRALRVSARDALPMQRDESGAPLGQWRALGRGRVGVWLLSDSFKLVLAGRDDLHGELWSEAVATLARARPRVDIVAAGDLRQGERIALCGVAKSASVIAPDGARTALLVDPAAGARACAAFWPRQSGWHRVQSGDLESLLIHVRSNEDAKGLARAGMREATEQLAAKPGVATDAIAAAAPRPGARWPWWLGWLLASGAMWWLERSRRGRVA